MRGRDRLCVECGGRARSRGQPGAQRGRLQHLDVRAEGQELAACLLDAWVRHMLLPEKPDLDAYLADFMPDGLTGRVA